MPYMRGQDKHIQEMEKHERKIRRGETQDEGNSETRAKVKKEMLSLERNRDTLPQIKMTPLDYLIIRDYY